MFVVQRSSSEEKLQILQRKGVGKTAVLFILLFLMAFILVAIASGQTLKTTDNPLGNEPEEITAIEWQTIQEVSTHTQVEYRHSDAANTVVPLTPAMKILPDEIEASDSFGRAIAISDELIVVGALGDDDRAVLAGAVYLFERGSGGGINNLTLLAKLVASDAEEGDKFGSSVAISGDSILIGVPFDDDKGYLAGAAYLFEKGSGWENGSGNQVAKLVAADGITSEYFGTTVAISGETAVIGAPFKKQNGNASGAAHIFEKGNGWQNGSGNQVAKIYPPDLEEMDYFSEALALQNDTIWIASRDDPLGAVYVFKKGAGWQDGSNSQVAKLIGSDASSSSFGSSIAVDEEMVAIGTKCDDENGYCSGAVYLFTEGAGWQDGSENEVVKLITTDGDVYDKLGWSVAISGDRVLVGTPFDDDITNNAGAAYLFEKGSGWQDGSANQVTKFIAADGEEDDYFGGTLGIEGETIVIGAYYDNDKGDNSGLAFLYDPPTSVSINDVSLTEGDSGETLFNFLILRADNKYSFSVDFATSDGTASIAGTDYLSKTGTINFSAGGELTQQISIQVNGDEVAEQDETFFVNLMNVTGNAFLLNGTGQGTIENDDVAGVSITESGAGTAVSEGASTTYNIQLTSRPQATVVVVLSAGNQLQLSENTFTFTPDNWNEVQSVTIEAVNDSDSEGDHTSTITCSINSNDANYSNLIFPGVTITIKDDDFFIYVPFIIN